MSVSANMAETFTGLKAGHTPAEVLGDIVELMGMTLGVEFTTLEEGKARIASSSDSTSRMIRISVEYAEPAENDQLSVG